MMMVEKEVDKFARMDGFVEHNPELNSHLYGDALPERCPQCQSNWSLFPPANVHGSNAVRCIECKSVLYGDAGVAQVGGDRLTYIATSWGNSFVQSIKDAVSALGGSHYHFLDSGHELDYNRISPNLRGQPARDQATALSHPSVTTAASVNAAALRSASVFILADPADKGSYMEFGMAVALGKPTILLVTESYTVGVMDAAFDYVVHDISELKGALALAFAFSRRAGNTTGTVKVKPLQWSNWSSHMLAESVVGAYTIKYDGDDPEPWTVRFGFKMIACCNGVEEAKSAADAHHSAAILSSLEPASSVEGEEPPVASEIVILPVPDGYRWMVAGKGPFFGQYYPVGADEITLLYTRPSPAVSAEVTELGETATEHLKLKWSTPSKINGIVYQMVPVEWLHTVAALLASRKEGE